LVHLQRIRAKYGLETCFSPNDDISKWWSTCNIAELKTRFETWITRNDVNGVKFVSPFLFNNTFGLPLLTNVQIKYFMFAWSIYRLLVLNRGWKRDTFQIMIFEFLSSTWSIVALKTRFETWITRKDVNVVSLFHLSYLITLTAYLCSQITPNVQIKKFMFDSSIYRLFVINRDWKHVSLQIMIFV
jgi:hypothetical protein